MNKTRHQERRETLAYWQADRVDTGLPVGRVSNLTEEGLNIHSTHTFRQGERMTIRILLEADFAGRDHIDLEIENVWSRPSVEDPAVFHAGFKVAHMSEEARQVVQRMLKEYSYPAPEPPAEI